MSLLSDSTSEPADSADPIQSRIFEVRGHKVMMDADLAELYGVQTKRLNEQVRRNLERFPEDFAFRLTDDEFDDVLTGSNETVSQRLLRSHFATARRKVRHSPWVFTEHGAIMAAAVLSSPEAVSASVYVVRAFVQMRRTFLLHAELVARVSELEGKVGGHDIALRGVIDALGELMAPPPEPPREKIGFRSNGTPGP